MTLSTEVLSICDLVAKQICSAGGECSIILLGSCARGEETYSVDSSGSRRLVSDLEFLIVENGRIDRNAISKRLVALRDQCCSGATPIAGGLDWSFVPRWKLPFMDCRFIHFETRVTGRIIYGDDERSRLPNVTVRNLNYSELNSILIHRLYHVVRDWHHVDERMKQYLIARNELDLVTVLLPHHGRLIASYRDRVNALPEVRGLGLGDEFELRMRRCLTMKLDLDSPLYSVVRSSDMLDDFLNDVDHVYCYLASLVPKENKMFAVGMREFASSLLHVRRSQMARVFMRGRVELALFEDLRRYLACRVWNGNLETEFAARMRATFGYS